MNNIPLNNNNQAPCHCSTWFEEKKDEERLNVLSSKTMF